jgi:hypothetical protein
MAEITLNKHTKTISVEYIDRYIVAFYFLCGCLPLLMPYWLVYVLHVEDRFFNTLRLKFVSVNIIVIIIIILIGNLMWNFQDCIQHF